MNSEDANKICCGVCGSDDVVELRGATQAVIRCRTCGEYIFRYTAEPHQGHHDDATLNQQIELDLLQQIPLQTQMLYELICRYMDRYGFAPTLREMQTEIGWESPNAVTHHLKQLEEIGLIEREYSVARGLRLLHK